MISTEVELYRQRLDRSLKAFKGDDFPSVKLDPKQGSPLTVVTGCDIAPFNPNYQHTPTKFYFEPTGRSHLVNCSASLALGLLDQDKQVIIHTKESRRDEVEKLISLYPNGNRATVISGNLGDRDFAKDLYSVISGIAQRQSISRVDFGLYESYSSGIEDPFVPIFDDIPGLAGRVATERISFYSNMAMLGYDLLLNQGQEELRFIAMTALASKRPSTHLFTDTIHKAVSTVFLETFATEAALYTGIPVSVIEIAPGMVDTGLYDSLSNRLSIQVEAEGDGFPFNQDVNYPDLSTWPMIAPSLLGEAAVLYLDAQLGEDITAKSSNDLIDLTTAGRDYQQLLCEFRQSIVFDGKSVIVNKRLPEYCYTPNSAWNALPPLRPGYIPVLLSPRGQLF